MCMCMLFVYVCIYIYVYIYIYNLPAGRDRLALGARSRRDERTELSHLRITAVRVGNSALHLTSYTTLHTLHSTWHATHDALHTTRFTLRAMRYTLHTTLYSAQHNTQFTQHKPHKARKHTQHNTPQHNMASQHAHATTRDVVYYGRNIAHLSSDLSIRPVFISSIWKNGPSPWEIWASKGHAEVSTSKLSGMRDYIHIHMLYTIYIYIRGAIYYIHIHMPAGEDPQ